MNNHYNVQLQTEVHIVKDAIMINFLNDIIETKERSEHHSKIKIVFPLNSYYDKLINTQNDITDLSDLIKDKFRFIKVLVKYLPQDKFKELFDHFEITYPNFIQDYFLQLIKYSIKIADTFKINLILDKFHRLYAKNNGNNYSYYAQICLLCKLRNDIALDIIINLWNWDRVKGCINYNYIFLLEAIFKNNIKTVKFFLKNIPKEYIDLGYYLLYSIFCNKLEISDAIIDNTDEIIKIKNTNNTIRKTQYRFKPVLKYISDLTINIRLLVLTDDSYNLPKLKIKSLNYLIDLYRNGKIKLSNSTILFIMCVLIRKGQRKAFDIFTIYFQHHINNLKHYEYADDNDLYDKNFRTYSIIDLLYNRVDRYLDVFPEIDRTYFKNRYEEMLKENRKLSKYFEKSIN
jgi:hypothetical protein